MKILKLYAWMVVMLCTVLLPSVHAARFYVDANAIPGGDGASWETAFRYLQDALDQTVSERGDDIWIAAGIYHPDDGANVTEGDRQASFFLKDGVSLYGGFAGGETELDQRDWEENESVLSGKIFEQDAFWSIHVCTVESGAEIRFDGLTITGGHANGSETAEDRSAAVYCTSTNYIAKVSNSQFTDHKAKYGGVAWYGTWNVSNSSFSENSASWNGGVAWYGTWNVSNSKFSGNSSTGSTSSHGGGVAWYGTWNVSNSLFSGNSANWGGGVASNSSWHLSNSLFTGNSASNGGGVSMRGVWHVSNSTFIGNLAGNGGVASNSTWNVSNSSFSDNSAVGGGGVASNSNWNVSNSGFIGNSAKWGGVAFSEGATWNVSNSSISDNSASSAGKVARYGTWILLNSIVDAQNSDDVGFLFSDMTRIIDTTESSPSPISPRAKNLIQGGLAVISMSTASYADTIPFLGEDSLIDADPLFVDSGNQAGPDGIWGTADDGLRLQIGSPAIGQGNPDFLPLDTFDLDNDGVTDEPIPIDRAGFPRVQGGSLDLGAYEFDGEENPMLSLTVQSTVGGSTNPSGQNNHALGTEITLTATPSPGNVFEGWTGGLESPDSVLTFTINSHLILTANFGHDLADDDDDGLTNYQEIVVYGTDPQNPDSSGDGILDGEAVAAELNPHFDYSAVIGVVNANPERFDLYNESSIMDLNLGGFMMRKVGNSVEIQFTIQKANNLVEGDWEDYQTISHTIDLPVSNYFMRLRAVTAQQD